MRRRRKKQKPSRVKSAIIIALIAAGVGGIVWTLDRYVPPQHLFWKPLDTSRPLGFATKQQLRRQRGNSSGEWSEHAFANAWDVAAFELRDGSLISVLKDWNGARQKKKFLRDARSAACDIFRVTLSPDYNAAHADHFHLDMGPSSSCR